MYEVDCTIQVPDIRDINRSTLKFVLRHAFMDTSDTINDSNLFTSKIDISDFVVKSILKDRDCKFSEEFKISNIFTIIKDLENLNFKVELRDDKFTRNERNEYGKILDGKDIPVKHTSYGNLTDILNIYLYTFDRKYLILYIVELIYNEYRECVDYIFYCHASIPYFIKDFKKRYARDINIALRRLSEEIEAMNADNIYHKK